jgi:hypothetical protein
MTPESVKPLPHAHKPAPASVSLLHALTGALLWAGAYFGFEPEWELALLWLGLLVCAPLALSLAGEHRLLRWARFAALPAAVLLVLAFALGPAAWPLALPWLAVTGLCALAGMHRLVTRGLRRAEALADWGLILFAVSGGSTFAAVIGWKVLGFAPIWVLLMGVHQLYAGLCLQVMASRLLSASRPSSDVGRRKTTIAFLTTDNRQLTTIAGIGISLGNPLIAAGIAGARGLEFPAVCLFSAAVILLALLQIRMAWRGKPGARTARVLLALSGMGALAGMALALWYAFGVWAGVATISLPRMIPTHGTIQALGFVLTGLIGWQLRPRDFSPAFRARPGLPA